MADKYTVELSDKALYFAVQMAYSEWSDAVMQKMDMLDEKDDGSEDWQLFHDQRVTAAVDEVDRLKAILDELTVAAGPMMRKVFEL